MAVTLGRIINVYRENEGVDSETLQLKIDEAILKGSPASIGSSGLLKSSRWLHRYSDCWVL